MIARADRRGPRLPVREVLTDTWSLYRRLFVRSLVVAASVFVFAELAQALLSVTTSRSATLGLLALSLLFWLVGTQLVQGALVEAVRDLHEGREPESTVELYDRTRDRLGALVVGSLLAGIGAVAGLFLLVVPGVVLFTRWSLVVPVIVLEQAPPVAALRRSNQLVRGHGWRVFRILLNVFVAAAVSSAVLEVAFGALPTFWAVWLGGLAASALVTPYTAHALTVLYYRLTEPDRPVVASAAPAWESIWVEEERTEHEPEALEPTGAAR